MGLPPNFLVISVLPFTFLIYGPPLFFRFFVYIYMIFRQLREIFLCFFLVIYNTIFTNLLRVTMDNIYVTT